MQPYHPPPNAPYPYPPPVQPWGAQQGPGPQVSPPATPKAPSTADLVVRFLLAVFCTPLFVMLAVALQQYQLLAVLVVTLVVVSALGGGHGLLEKYPLLGRIKLLGGILRLTGDLDAFYKAHPPRGFLLYAFYPFYAFFGAIVSPVVRREVVLHLRLLLVVALLVVLDLAASYGRLYPPYLSWKDALGILAIQLTLIILFSAAYLMPMITTVYAFGASGRRWLTRGLVIGSVLLAAPLAVATYFGTRDAVGWLDKGRLTDRLEKKLFRQHLREETEMYLAFASAHGQYDDVGDAPVVVPAEPFRRMLKGLVPGTEDRAFSIIAMRGPGGVWTGLRMLQAKHPILLMVRAPKGSVATQWAQLPPDIQEKFRVGSVTKKDQGADLVFVKGLMDDFASR